MNHTPSNPDHSPTSPNTAGAARRRMVPLTVWLRSDTTDPAPPTTTSRHGAPARGHDPDQAVGASKQLCRAHWWLPRRRRMSPAGRERGCPACRACRADLWMLGAEQLALFLAAAWKVLRPGGVLAIITTARHQAGRLVDPAPRIIRQAQAQGLGFRYVQHVIALRVPIDGDALVIQAGPADLAELRDTRSRALPPPVSVHADVCLFTKPQPERRDRQDGDA
ncbi:hypothetical protein [Actinomadura sp. 9N215]|uniref:hypothetical protein n=1 Tax=Actinomadura sp. 9N215 TaxID=3375150 RepID=UPI0037A98129